MLSGLASLLLLTAMGLAGVALLGRFAGYLDPLEQHAYGLAAGVVLGSLALLLLACLFGLNAGVIAAVGTLCGVGAILGHPWRGRRPPRSLATGFALIPSLVLGGFVVRWVLLWAGAYSTDADGLWVGHVNLWGDWARHLGDVTSFAYGDNFPPVHPRLAGEPFAYHYLTSITVAAMVKLGLTPTTALSLHSFLFSIIVAVGIYAFAKRLTQDRGAASLVLVLFLLGGGLGWWVTVEEIYRTQELIGTLLNQPWDNGLQKAHNFQWMNVYFSLIAPQRAYLYGLPLGLLVLTLLWESTQNRKPRAFLIAGLVAGSLPFVHLGTMLALALVTPFLFLLFPRWGWFRFFVPWIVLAVPQLLLQQGGRPGVLGSLRAAPGWMAAPDSWVWFWVKNLGLFLSLLIVSLALSSVVRPPARRFLAGFMPLFVIANLVVFQPWDWDNTKILAYWFLACCILVGALLTLAWRELRAPVARVLLVIAVATMTLSGALQNLQQLLGKDRHRFLTADELELAERVRAETDPHAVFAVGLQHNHPVPVMTGRRVMMTFPGWLWSQGVDYVQRETDLRAIFSLAPEAEELIARYGIDYVVVGPDERKRFDADPAEFRARYPGVIRTNDYEVFATAKPSP